MSVFLGFSQHAVCRPLGVDSKIRSRSTSIPRNLLMRRRVLSAVFVLTFGAGAQGAFAQTSLVPYFGKNNIHYDKFKWMIYTTDHFEIYYYPELEQHLERVAG